MSGVILVSEGKYMWGAILLVLGVLAGIGPFYRFLKSPMSMKAAETTSERGEQGGEAK